MLTTFALIRWLLNMRRIRTKKYILDHDLYVLAFTSALIYYLYQHLIIHTAVTFPQGSCLYSFWLAGGWYSPYNLFCVTVALIVALGIAITIKDILRGRLNLIRGVIIAVFFIVMALWLRTLYGMFKTFEYEKGNISSVEYFSTDKKQSSFKWYTEEDFHSCEKDT